MGPRIGPPPFPMLVFATVLELPDVLELALELTLVAPLELLALATTTVFEFVLSTGAVGGAVATGGAGGAGLGLVTTGFPGFAGGFGGTGGTGGTGGIGAGPGFAGA